MAIKYGEPVYGDLRKEDQSKLTPSQQEVVRGMIPTDLSLLMNRGFHGSYLLLLSIALGEAAELRLKSQ